jgi:hypothetical protein
MTTLDQVNPILFQRGDTPVIDYHEILHASCISGATHTTNGTSRGFGAIEPIPRLCAWLMM